MDENKRILIVEITNNNHVSNVKTLQSIFRQDYPCLELVILNDDTDAFQCERLMWNITDHTPDRFHHVQIVENTYPLGEAASLRRIVEKTAADYVMILHSGERFSSDHALSNCLEALEAEQKAGVLIAPVEERSPNLKSLVAKHCFTANVGRNENIDSMFFYRTDALRGLLKQLPAGSVSVCEGIYSALRENALLSLRSDSPICIFTEKEIEDEHPELPSTLGNETLQNIEGLMEEREKSPYPANAGEKTTAPEPSPKGKRILWLFKNSRFLRIKTNILIDLMMIFLAVLFFVEEILPPAWIIFTAVAAVLTVWIMAMLICNLYFRKHPERLVC